MSTPRRYMVLVVLPLFLAVWWSVATATPAAAHVRLDLLEPLDGARLSGAPTSLTLVASEPLEAGSVQVEVHGQLTRTDVSLAPGAPGERAKEWVVAITGEMPDDAYLVEAQATGLDGHTVASTWAFVIGTGPAVSATGGVTGAGADPTTAALLETSRVVATVVTPLLAVPLVLALVYPGGFIRRRVRRVFWAGMACGVTALVVELVATSAALGGSWGDPAGVALAWGIPPGKLLMVRIAALVALGAACVGLRRAAVAGSWSPTQANLAIGSAAVAVLANAAGSHAAEDETGMLALVVSAAHLGAVSLWLGGVVVWWCCALRVRGTAHSASPTPSLPKGRMPAETGGITTLVPAAPETRIRGACTGIDLGRFALMARWSVAVAVASGLFLAWRLTEGFDGSALTGGYGGLLVAKLGLVGLLLTAALASHRLVSAGTNDPAGVARALRFELAVGTAVMMVGALLAEIG